MTRSIPHRELRNDSSAVLRAVQAGEVLEVTNHGEVVAVLSPPNRSPAAGLAVRRATRTGFASLDRVTLARPAQEVLDELRER